MDLTEALEVLHLIRSSDNLDFEDNARVVTHDGETFFVEWFEMNYWYDYQNTASSRDAALKAVRDGRDTSL